MRALLRLREVRFSADQVILVPRSVVEDAFADPGFYRALGEMASLHPPEVLERRRDEGDPAALHLRVRYAFAGHLAAPVRAVVDPAKVTWVDHSTLDRARHRVEFRMVPEHYPERLSCSGCYRFEVDEADPGATHQVMAGEIAVHYPLVGTLVERGILLGLRQHLVEEAAVLERWAASRKDLFPPPSSAPLTPGAGRANPPRAPSGRPPGLP